MDMIRGPRSGLSPSDGQNVENLRTSKDLSRIELMNRFVSRLKDELENETHQFFLGKFQSEDDPEGWKEIGPKICHKFVKVVEDELRQEFPDLISANFFQRIRGRVDFSNNSILRGASDMEAAARLYVAAIQDAYLGPLKADEMGNGLD